MNPVLPLVVGTAAVALLGWRLHCWNLRRQAFDRLFAQESAPDLPADAGSHPGPVPVHARPWLQRSRWVPWMLAVALGVSLYGLAGIVLPFALAAGALTGLLGHQFEAWLAARRSARLEEQLADAIDLMVGALSAGAGAATALDAALNESRRPLHPVLDDVRSRIRLGDDPRQVFHVLTLRVPLETFLLFATTLAVHWEVGGPLAPTLATVGRTIRDRIELSRKIRSGSVQAQLSVVAVLFVTYFLAGVIWRTDPARMREFLDTAIAAWLVAGTIVLQGIGIVWMSALSRPRF